MRHYNTIHGIKKKMETKIAKSRVQQLEHRDILRTGGWLCIVCMFVDLGNLWAGLGGDMEMQMEMDVPEYIQGR